MVFVDWTRYVRYSAFLFKLEHHAINKIFNFFFKKPILKDTSRLIQIMRVFRGISFQAVFVLFWYHDRWISKSWPSAVWSEMDTTFVFGNVIVKIAGEFHTVHKF